MPPPPAGTPRDGALTVDVPQALRRSGAVALETSGIGGLRRAATSYASEASRWRGRDADAHSGRRRQTGSGETGAAGELDRTGRGGRG